ncbi:Hypothetical protein NTJ_05818 [Nesidiocoris tenuis]|uniref:Uncharacterized protein n=1 Tax=Nesidiocoris tenuis TaxID=355587 RepID=A0ABN7ARL3_9HEMI|nr:Hypothetical protein NTJ_05818 [Nesidiocoris tenuis]
MVTHVRYGQVTNPNGRKRWLTHNGTQRLTVGRTPSLADSEENDPPPLVCAASPGNSAGDTRTLKGGTCRRAAIDPGETAASLFEMSIDEIQTLRN